ncbi:MAG: hypothetical protein LH702_18560 [Phormidesmis sp. CAN_BIN44]|nr:hypothetical protein [Phormidesmis sp. CAN_BIN44]
MTLPNVHPKKMTDEHLLPAALLETGDTLNFLEVRKHSLRVKIKESKLSAATGKVSGISAIASGGLLYFTLANPLGALLACGGLAAYGLAVGAQWLQTGKLHPFPLSSKTADESDEELSASTLTGGSLHIARSHIQEEASYLEPREKAEYELLHHAPQGLLNAVSSVAPAQRWACYCFLLDAHMTGTLDDYRDRKTLDTVLGNSSVYNSHLPEAQERFPEFELGDATAPSLPAANDALPTATSSPIGPTTKLGAIEVPSSSAINPPSLDMGNASTFDWNRLNTDYNDFPHLFLLGKTGAGKSYVSDRLVRFLDGYAIVISPKKMPTDFQGLQVVGLPYDYRAIHRALVALEKLMVDREAEIQQTGFTDFQPINVILDELPVSSSGCKDLDLDLLKPLKALIRAGRTSKIRLIILAQGSEVKALGIEGEGGLRDSLTYVYLKGFVEDYAAKSKIDISKVDRPCIIDSQIADTSFLAQFETTYRAGLDLTGQAAKTKDAKWCQDKGMIPGTPEHLDRLFNLPSPDQEVEEDAIESVSSRSSIQSAFPNWKPKSQDIAAKVIDWMIERADKSFLPSEVRNGIRTLKSDKEIDNDRVKKLLDLLADKQLISVDESGRYSLLQQSTDDDYNF